MINLMKNKVSTGPVVRLFLLLWVMSGVAAFAVAGQDAVGASGIEAETNAMAKLSVAGDDQAQELRQFASPVLRTRYYALLAELRCPKCQNQNLADSDAPIAADLRDELTRLLHENYSDTEIKQYMVARFGSFVLYAPPASAYTAMLYIVPGVLVLVSAALVWRVTAGRRAMSESGRASGQAGPGTDD